MFSDLEQKVGTKAVVHFGPVSAEKQRIAEEVASMLKLNVDIDTTSSERLVSFSFFYLLLLHFAYVTLGGFPVNNMMCMVQSSIHMIFYELAA